MTIPAVVSILDLGTTSVATTGMRFEASYTASGVATTVQVGLDQIMTAGLGALPTGGATGQLLGKPSGTDYATGWVSPSSFVAANATSGLTVAGSTSLALALASVAGLSVLGVPGATQAIATALIGTTGQIFGVNTSTAGFFAATTMMPGPFQTSTLGAFGVVIAQGASPLQVAAPSTAGNLLVDQGAAANPAFKVVSGDITITANGTVAIAANVVSYAKIQAGTGLAVLGFATTAASNVTTFVASAANQVLQVATTGTSLAWGLPAQVLLNTLSPNGVATIGDTTSFSSAFRSYLITFENITPANITAQFQLQVATSGSTFLTGGYQGCVPAYSSAASTAVAVSASASTILLSGALATTTVSSTAGVGVSGFLRVFNPSGAAGRKVWVGEVGYFNASAVNAVLAMPMGYLDGNNALTAFQFLFTPGNIATGTIKVYGLT